MKVIVIEVEIVLKDDTANTTLKKIVDRVE